MCKNNIINKFVEMNWLLNREFLVENSDVRTPNSRCNVNTS